MRATDFLLNAVAARGFESLVGSEVRVVVPCSAL